MQKERFELADTAITEKQRRKASPGVERKYRRISPDKRKRRPSMVNKDEHIDIDEPWSQSYGHICQDIDKNLEQVAQCLLWEMTGDVHLNLIFILSYLSYLSLSITNTHLRLYIFTSIL